MEERTDEWITDKQPDRQTEGRADGQTEGRTDKRSDGRINGRTDKWTDKRMDGRTKRMEGPKTPPFHTQYHTVHVYICPHFTNKVHQACAINIFLLFRPL
jgi:hypothetical protein